MVIKDVLKEKGIKKSWLADKVGVSRTMMSFYLNNVRPMPSHIEQKIKSLLS